MKRIVFPFVILILFALTISTASADGAIHLFIEGTWELFNEEQQECIINYHHGTQTMLLNVDTAKTLRGEKAVWIFPVPAAPEETDLNIIKGFPQLGGYDVEKKASQEITKVFNIMRASQIYPLPIQHFEPSMLLPIRMMPLQPIGGHEKGVTVHESVEKLGLTTELISAKDGTSLSNYIISKDLALPEASQKIMKEYIGEEYSFVISWVSDMEVVKAIEKERVIPYLVTLLDLGKLEEAKEFIQESGADDDVIDYILDVLNNKSEDIAGKKQSIQRYFAYEPKKNKNKLGVFLTFPTEKIYYPLRPTSVYGDYAVPGTIYVLDYVEPDLYQGIRSDTEVSYFFTDQLIAPEALNNVFSGFEKETVPLKSKGKQTDGFAISDVKYTVIRWDTPSKHLTQDLWMEVSTPLKVKLARAASKHQFVYGLIIFALSSCTASLLSGIVLLQDQPIPKRKFALFGLSNFLTIIGFFIAAKVWGLMEDKKIFGFCLQFSIFFVIITIFLQILLNAAV